MATVADVNERVDKLEGRINSLELSHNGLNERIIRLDAKMDGYNKDLKHMSDITIEIKNDVKTLMQEPGKKWNNVSMFVLTFIVSSVLGFVLNHLLK